MQKIFSYWHGPKLRRTDWVCIESWVRHGFDVTIYSHNPDLALPPGAKLGNADQILGISYLDKLQPLIKVETTSWQSVVSYADIFRVAGTYQSTGLWLDTDVFVIRPFSYDETQPVLGWEGFKRIGASVIYLPPNCPMAKAYLKVLQDVEQVPDWVEFRKAVWRPLRWRLQGRPYRPNDLGITIFGNYAFTRLGRKYYKSKDILPKHRFYHWIGDETRRFYQDPRGEEALNLAQAWGIHVHRKDLDMATPEPGSLYDEALKASSYPN